MIPVGYLYKWVAAKSEWLKAGGVVNVYSLSGCISEPFADYVQFWKHNGHWLFDTPGIIEDIAATENIDLLDATLFYYEAYECEYDSDSKKWTAFAPEHSFVTNVQVPSEKYLEGFDVTAFSGHAGPECSPLSCNGIATMVRVNAHCLFDTFAEAKDAVERGIFSNSEPGPYRLFAVYTLGAGRSRISA